MPVPVKIMMAVIFAVCMFYAIRNLYRERKKARLEKKFAHLPLCKLGELRVGDSFLFSLSKPNYSWIVTRRGHHLTYINRRFRSTGKKLLTADECRPADTMVYFIRHTIPAIGEMCFIEDLHVGDVFTFPEGMRTEWRIIKKGYDFDTVKDIRSGHIGRIGRLAQVRLIRKTKEVV